MGQALLAAAEPRQRRAAAVGAHALPGDWKVTAQGDLPAVVPLAGAALLGPPGACPTMNVAGSKPPLTIAALDASQLQVGALPMGTGARLASSCAGTHGLALTRRAMAAAAQLQALAGRQLWQQGGCWLRAVPLACSHGSHPAGCSWGTFSAGLLAAGLLRPAPARCTRCAPSRQAALRTTSCLPPGPLPKARPGACSAWAPTGRARSRAVHVLQPRRAEGCTHGPWLARRRSICCCCCQVARMTWHGQHLQRGLPPAGAEPLAAAAGAAGLPGPRLMACACVQTAASTVSLGSRSRLAPPSLQPDRLWRPLPQTPKRLRALLSWAAPRQPIRPTMTMAGPSGARRACPATCSAGTPPGQRPASRASGCAGHAASNAAAALRQAAGRPAGIPMHMQPARARAQAHGCWPGCGACMWPSSLASLHAAAGGWLRTSG